MRRPLLALILAAGLTGSAFDGATTHVPALVLRLACAVLCTLLLAWGPPLQWRGRDLAVPLFALAVVALGLLGAPSPGRALQPMISVIIVVAVYTAVLLCPDRRLPDDLLSVAVGAGALHSCWAVGERALGSERGSSGFFNPNDLAAFVAPLFALALGRSLARGEIHRRIWIATTFLLGAGIVASGSRSGLLAVLAAGAVIVVARAPRRRLALLLLALCIVAALALTARRWTGSGDPYAFSRLQIWRASADLALSQPFGVGLAGYTEAMRRHGVPLAGAVRYPRVADEAHSEPIQAWVELGVPGLFATLLPPLFVALIIWRRRKQAKAPEADPWSDPAVLLGVLLSLAIPALVSVSLHVPPIAVLAAIWAGRTVRLDAPTMLTARRGLVQRLAPALVGLAALAALPDAASHVATQSAARARDRGDLNEALRLAELGEGLAPWRIEPGMLAASLEHLRGEDRLSMARLVDLAVRFPNSPRPLERAAWVLEQQLAKGDPALAATAAQARARALERDPLDALGFVSLGRDELAAQEPDRARAAFERALAVEPSCGRALAHLSVMAREQGNLRLATALAEEARAAGLLAASSEGHAKEVLSLDPLSSSMLTDATKGAP